MTIRRRSRRPSSCSSRSRSRPGRRPRACGFFEPTLFVSPYAPTRRSTASPPASSASSSRRGSGRTSSSSYRYLAGIPLARTSRLPRSRTGRAKEPGSPGGDAWTAAREAATGEKGPQVAAERWVGYSSYVNCGDDAFQTRGEDAPGLRRDGMERTLPRREAGWPRRRPCSRTAPTRSLLFPEYLPASAPAPLRADRAYQLASASFYAGRLEEAQRGFEEIANDAVLALARDRALPRRSGGRCVEATLGSGEKTGYLRLLDEARARFLRRSRRSSTDPGAPALVRGPPAVRRAASRSRRARRLRRRASPEAAGRGRVRGLLRPLPRSPVPRCSVSGPTIPGANATCPTRRTT